MARAEGNVVVATCSTSGCECLLTELSVEEATITLGEAPPEGVEDPLLVETDEGYVWTAMTAEELDLTSGGPGECELAFFPAITPRDGTWFGQVTDRQVSGCPAGLDSALEPGLAGLGRSRRVLWEGVFHPQKLSPGSTVSWSKVTDDRYSGIMPLQSGGPVRMSAIWDSQIRDPEFVQAKLDFRLSMDGGQLAMLGLANCKVRVFVEFRRTGD
ncbi:hypothetical protein [Frigidibacter sp. ROC022]|uniref:hypothetical protein n=1 Tax=Frigidibacter sp. ROC022 TaxID=2971796 RepID=UPI00215B72BD|nr:hypothetical protein [Frigidibacter sp. ROC022]MCR8723639.1 hypothetical protein [Frigidibacter sp. ROC022]